MKTIYIKNRTLATFDGALMRVVNLLRRAGNNDREELSILFAVENEQGEIYREINVGGIKAFASLIRLLRKFHFLVELIDPDKDNRYQAIVRKSSPFAFNAPVKWGRATYRI